MGVVSFRLKGFINHYPDFIIHIKNGKTVLLETKGDHLDAKAKNIPGGFIGGKQLWLIFLAYEKREETDALTLKTFLAKCGSCRKPV